MKLLYALGAPKTFFRVIRPLHRVLGVLACLGLLLGWGWGFFFSPPDYQQGESVRLMYLHVPAAMLSLSIYGVMAFCALCVLVWRIKIAGLMLHACATVGFVMTFIALFTGSLWGKPTWGTYWVWDARLTSELILLMIYAGLLALSNTLGHNPRSEKIVAIICWVGVLDLPIIHYSVQWWNTLHQGSSLSLFAKPQIDQSMLYPLLVSLMGLACFCGWAILSLSLQALLKREYQQDWVKKICKA